MKEKTSVDDKLLSLFEKDKYLRLLIKEEIKEALFEFYQENEKPKYIIHLIEKGFLYPDGERIINSLKETAAAYVLFTKQNVTSQFLEESFTKADGTKYKESTYAEARDYANTK
jgi:hypothetical protein